MIVQADLVSVVEQRDTVTRERDSLQSSVKVQETSLTQQLQQYKEMQARCTQLEGQLSESASAKQNVDASVTALRRQFTEEQQQWRTTEHVLTGEIRAEKLAQAKQAGVST